MERLAGNGLDGDEMSLNNCNMTSLSSELSFSPYLAKLFLQENNSLTMIPPYFFQHILVLQVLDLSRTSIQSLPPSISRLYLLEKLILQDCSLLMEVPPEVGALKHLKLFDLEGTELMYLPKQVGNLETLEYLRVSLSACADDQKDRYGIQYIIPRMMISKLSKLKELSISVDPEAEWWEVELLEAIMGDLPFLPEIKFLKLYLPTAKALQQFLRLERFRVPIFSSLWNYRFMIGHCEQLPFSVQLDMEESFLKLEKCVKYMNGEGYTNETAELIRDAEALYLRRHWNAEKLSVFDTRRLKYCLLMECNELQTLLDHGDLYIHKNGSTSHTEGEILGSLEYLSIHFMKKLQRISKGRIGRNSLSCLRILALHTCPKLTSIFTGCLLGNMQSLTELIVEDCPEVKCLVDLGEVTPWSNGPFLVSLRKVSLIDLPELVSISDGVSIAPQLDTLLIFNCMKLNYLSDMEISSGTKVIKGEIEWWDALKHGKLTWQNVFVPLKRDGGLMDQLAEDTNSLKHFLDLEMIPSHHGSSSHVDQNSLMDHHLGCYYVSTKEELEHVDPLHIDSLQSSNENRKTEVADRDMKAVNQQLASAEKKSNNSDIDSHNDKGIQQLKRGPQIGDQVPDSGRKYLENGIHNSRHPSDEDQETIVLERQDYTEVYASGSVDTGGTISYYLQGYGRGGTETAHTQKGKKEKVSFKTKSQVEVLDDGFKWRKYGKKMLKNSQIPRNYYRCSAKGCLVKKRVERDVEDAQYLITTYEGIHNHQRPSRDVEDTQYVITTQIEDEEPQDSGRKHLENGTYNSRHPSDEDQEPIVPEHQDYTEVYASGSVDNGGTISYYLPGYGRDGTETAHAQKGKKEKIAFKTKSQLEVLDDGFKWRKYGKKMLKNSQIPRNYYRCSAKGCLVKKRVERDVEDAQYLITTYEGIHNHQRPSRDVEDAQYVITTYEGIHNHQRPSSDVEDAQYVITTYEGIHNHQSPSSDVEDAQYVITTYEGIHKH